MVVKPGEQVVITADLATDPAAISAIGHAARVQGAKLSVIQIPQLPYQGSLADPYVPEPAVAAVSNCDVWFDLTFPYMGGSAAHQAAMDTGRVRSLLIADLGGDGIARLFGKVSFDKLFAVQSAFDKLIADSVGEECHVSCPAGSDFTFTIGKPATQKLRHTNRPGTYTPPGSAAIYPDPKTVRGEVVIRGTFHEYHTKLDEPIRLTVDGQIREVTGGGPERAVLERALKRAAGGKYGSIIHLTQGFHPAARFTGKSFMEDIRTCGANAIGFGIPWWEEGGGENHPDGVTMEQSMTIGGVPIVRAGEIVGPGELVRLAAELEVLHA